MTDKVDMVAAEIGAALDELIVQYDPILKSVTADYTWDNHYVFDFGKVQLRVYQDTGLRQRGAKAGCVFVEAIKLGFCDTKRFNRTIELVGEAKKRVTNHHEDTVQTRKQKAETEDRALLDRLKKLLEESKN